MKHKKTLGLIFSLVVLTSLILLISCGGKKKEKVSETSKEPTICKASRIEIQPSSVDSPDITIGSGKSLELTAKAYSEEGAIVNENIRWYFRGLPEGFQGLDDKTRGGHRLEANGMRAKFLATGYEAGVMKIAAEAINCVDKNEKPVRGTVEITVKPRPTDEVVCGPIEIRYGPRDITNETVIGFLLFELYSEVYGPTKLKDYKVQFYMDDKKVNPKRSLIYDKDITPKANKERAYFAYQPVWLKNGDYRAHYELYKGNELVCGSREIYFTTR